MSYRGRFAPSPTGRLHFGSLVTAVAGYLDARANQGTWLLRIDDLDPPREIPGAGQRFIDDLGRLGMVSDESVWWQGTRTAAYRQAMQHLLDMGLAFPCDCTRRSLPPNGWYPGTCLKTPPDGSRQTGLRLIVPNEPIAFEDRIQGARCVNLQADCGPFLIQRRDQLIAYQLAAGVDDAAQGITDVVRGADLLDSTPRQIAVQRALGLPTPRYAHLPIALDRHGKKLSKQTAARAIDIGHPLPALIAAWRFLGQRSDVMLGTLTVKDYWQRAVPNWSFAAIPRQAGKFAAMTTRVG